MVYNFDMVYPLDLAHTVDMVYSKLHCVYYSNCFKLLKQKHFCLYIVLGKVGTQINALMHNEQNFG